MKLLIAVPTYDYIHYQFVECLTKLVRHLDSDGVDYELALQGGTLVYVGRDKLAKRAIDGGFTHTLWIDSDMIFTEDLLDDLMFCGKPFVSGIAHSRRSPHVSCLFKQIWPMVDRWEGHEYPTNAFKVGGCGFGCVLLQTDVIRAVWMANGTAFFPMRELGEDLAFCKRAADLGFEIWAEPSVWLGHIGHVTIYPEYQDEYGKGIANFERVMNHA